MRRPKQWVVRLGSKRGAGKYLSWDASLIARLVGRGFATERRGFTSLQKRARVFDMRKVAEAYASAFFGRVVRLKPRGAK